MSESEDTAAPREERGVPRNVVAASVTSFLMDVSTEMVVNVFPLYLANVLGARTAVIGLIEGLAHATAGLLNLVSGSLSDRVGHRKWLAVAGYAVSALARPGFALASTWPGLAAARWADRVGKGIRGAPRDALIAESITSTRHGFAFGLNRAADTAGAVLGLGIAIAVVAALQGSAIELDRRVFTGLVALSLLPAAGAVLVLAIVAREPAREPAPEEQPRSGPLRALGRPFGVFLAVSGVFHVAHFAEGFLVLRAQERGLSVIEGLLGLVVFSVVSSLLSVPAGRASDRLGRRRVVAGGWLAYAITCLGFARAENANELFVWFAAYGVFHAVSIAALRALVADLVPPALRGTAFGCHHALIALTSLPASLIAGVLWQGVGSWQGLGPAAPFYFSAAAAAAAAILLLALVRERPAHDRTG